MESTMEFGKQYVNHLEMEYLSSLNHEHTRLAVACAREFLSVLNGNCRTRIAAYAYHGKDGNCSFRGLLALPDGSIVYETSRSGTYSFDHIVAIGQDAGHKCCTRFLR